MTWLTLLMTNLSSGWSSHQPQVTELGKGQRPQTSCLVAQTVRCIVLRPLPTPVLTIITTCTSPHTLHQFDLMRTRSRTSHKGWSRSKNQVGFFLLKFLLG